MCLFVCLFFWETGLFLFCIFAWWIIVFFWRFWWGFSFSYFFFFPAGFSNLMEVYRRFIVWQKSPSGFYHNSSQRLIFFSFLECYMLRFDELFCSCTNVPESFLFVFFYSGTSGNGSTVFKTGKWHIWLFFRWTAVQVLRSDSEFD